MNNTHQLGLSWIMYATDNRDVLVQNQNLGGPGGVPGSWATGFRTWTFAPDNTNVACLTDPTYAKPGEYISKNKNIFKCPADHFVSPYH